MKVAVLRQNSEEEEESFPAETLVIYFILIALSVGTVTRLINKKTGLSTSALTFLVGLLMQVFLQHKSGLTQQALEVVQSFTTQGIISVFLPILSFYNAFTLDYPTFRKQLKPVFALAVPTTIINSLLLTLAIKILYQSTHYTWPTAFILSSILSATDGFSTISLVDQLGMSAKFKSLLKCESLFNNAISYSLILIAINQITLDTNPFKLLLIFLSLNLSGIILGVTLGFITSQVMKGMFNDYIQVTNLTFLVGFFSLFIANQLLSLNILPVSALMTLLFTGLYMAAFGKSKINPESKHALMTFWDFAVFAAEQILFMLAGVFSANRLMEEQQLITIDDFYRLFALYMFMLLVRYLSLTIHKSILTHHGSRISENEVIILWHTGGIRGAISIIFALMVCERSVVFLQLERTIILFHVVGCVLLSLFINGITSAPLVTYLGFKTQSRSKAVIYSYFLNGYLQTVAEKKETMKSDQFMQVTDWKQVDQLAGVDDVQGKFETLKRKHAIEAKVDYELQEKGQKDYINDEKQMKDNEEEARSKTIQCIKGVVHHLYEQNQCSGETSQLLRQILQDDHDDSSKPMSSWNRLSEQFYQQTSIQKIEQFSKIPLIGNLMKNIVLSEINKFHDSICTYIISVQRTVKIVQQLTLDPYVRAVILRELDDNLQHAEEYYYGYLQSSYSGISKQVQNKKAALSLIDKQMCFTRLKLSEGQITEKEFNKVKSLLDKHVLALENMPLDFQQEPQKQFIQNLPFFRLLKDDQITQLMNNSSQKLINKGDYLFKLNDKITHFYVLQNGSALEEFEQEGLTFSERKPVGSIISYLNLFAQHKQYQSSFLAKSEVTLIAFDIKQLRKFVKQNTQLESYVYKENMKIMKHISPNIVKDLGHLDSQQLLQVLSCCQYQKIQVGQQIDMTEGGIILRGTLMEYNENDIESKNLLDNFFFIQKNADNNKEKTNNRNQKLEESLKNVQKTGWYDGAIVIYPKESSTFLQSQVGIQEMRRKYDQKVLVATKKTIIFKFTEYEQINDILTIDELAQQVRQSFARPSAVRNKKQ